MRILFVCSAEKDYLQDLTYAGLSAVLGKESVIDFPFHWQYHRERKFPWSKKLAYPENLGFFPLQIIPSQTCSLRTVIKSLNKNEFAVVLLASAKPDALKVFHKLQNSIRAPWVFVDGGDWNEIGGDFRRTGGEECFAVFKNLCKRIPPAIVFKRELSPGTRDDNLYPLPFSLNSSLAPILPPASGKKIQVLFRAVESSETRRQVFKLLKGKYDCDRNGSVSGQTYRTFAWRGEPYFEALNQTGIALSFRGVGFDTLRFWEIPAGGALLLSERPLIEVPHPFEDKKHAVFCKNDLSDLCSLIDYYLAHKSEQEEIAREGQKHLGEFHTHIRRAEYILEIFRSRL